MGFFSVFLIAFTLYACGGSEEATDLSDVVNNPSDSIRNSDGGVLSNVISDGAIPFDPANCGKESANDFNNFLKIPYGASEMMLDTIIGKSTAGEYVEDSSSLVFTKETPFSQVLVNAHVKEHPFSVKCANPAL